MKKVPCYAVRLIHSISEEYGTLWYRNGNNITSLSRREPHVHKATEDEKSLARWARR
jgi:hypothetical protein